MKRLNDGKRDRSDEHISDEQYLHLKNVWNTFNFNNFKIFTIIIPKTMYYC